MIGYQQNQSVYCIYQKIRKGYQDAMKNVSKWDKIKALVEILSEEQKSGK